MKGRRIALSWLIFAAVALSTAGSSFGEAGQAGGDDAEREMHHLHILLNHGVSMAAEGSNLIMLAGMQTTPALDRPTLRHGQMMLASGRDLIRRSLEGPEMASLSEGGRVPSHLVRYSRRLGESMLAYLARLETLDIGRMSSPRTLTLQRMNVILNHALQMASEGANLVMIARMGVAGEVDRLSLEHGERMITRARDLHRETMEGEAMKRMLDLGVAEENRSMLALTRGLADDVSGIIEWLARMPPPSSVAAPHAGRGPRHGG